MAVAQWIVTKQMVADTGGSGGVANPGDLHLPVGRWDPGTGLSWITRVALYAPINFGGMTSVNSATLFLRTHTAAGWHANGSGTKNLAARRKTSDWAESSAGTSTAVDEIYGGNGAAIVAAGFTEEGGNGAAISTDTADNTLVGLDITAIAQAWHAGNPNYGLFIFAGSGETSSLNSFEFYSRHFGGRQPYIEVNYNTNTPPNAPVNLSPGGNNIYNGGTAFTFSAERSDPDAGDYISAYRIVNMLDDGTWIADSGKVFTGGTPTSFAHGGDVGAYGANRWFKWMCMTWDKADAPSPWSGHSRYKLNTPPNPPTNLSAATNTLTPFLSCTASDPDTANGDTITAAQIDVVRENDGAFMWNSGVFATGPSISRQYAGPALSFGTTYRFRVSVADINGVGSPWSNWFYWVPVQPSGPTMSPRTTTAGAPDGGKINDTTPNLTLTYPENFTDHEIFVYSNEAGTNLVFSDTPSAYTGTTSKVVTVTTPLTNGATYYWKARVLVQSTGTFTQFGGFISGQSGNLNAKFYINALPTAATGVLARTRPEKTPIVRSTDGVYIVTDLVPMLEAVYSDPDIIVYGDAVSARQIEIYNDATSVLVHTNEDLAPGASVPMRYFPGTITNSTTLAAAAVTGATNVKVTSVTGYAIGDRVRIGPSGGTQEVRIIQTVGTAGSGGTGLTLTEALAHDHASGQAISEITAVLANETTYKMRWRFQDNSDTYGAWSEYSRFKVTQPSTLGSVTPSGTVTSPQFTATWNHGSPGGKSQGKCRVRIIRDSDEALAYDSGELMQSTESHTVPAGKLVNGTAYTIEVEAVDTDGV